MAFSVASVRAAWQHYAAALLLLLTGALFYGPYLTEMPTGIHTWAQCDRLALAVNYYDYGLRFFTPRTYSLLSIGGVTGVEFPLQPYAVALLAQVFGRDSIVVIFRLLNASIVTLGFYFMFRLVYERTGHFVAGLVPAAFLLASPTFAFYAGAFTPDPFSFSLGFIAFYYWLRFFEQRQFSDLIWALGLLTVAALVKTTIALYLALILGVSLLWGFVEPTLFVARQRRFLLAMAITGVSLIIFYFLYNQSLNTKYLSTQFMASANPIPDLEALHEIVKHMRQFWADEYATHTQYRTVGVCLLVFVGYINVNVKRRLPLTILFGVSLLVLVLFVSLMGNGLGVHDYHLICSLGPPALLVLILALLNLGQYTGKVRIATSIGLAILTISLAVSGYKRLQLRMADTYLPFSLYYTHLWLRGGAAELQQAKVPAAAKILVLGESSPNVALTYFDRQGLIWDPGNLAQLTTPAILSQMAAYGLDYLVVSPKNYSKLTPMHAELATAFESVAQQPAVVLRRRDLQYPW